jgi:hypothetical protein
VVGASSGSKGCDVCGFVLPTSFSIIMWRYKTCTPVISFWCDELWALLAAASSRLGLNAATLDGTVEATGAVFEAKFMRRGRSPKRARPMWAGRRKPLSHNIGQLANLGR